MIKTCKLLLLFLLFATTSFAQMPLTERKDEAPKERFLDRVSIGGSLGLQFGTQTYVEIAPIITYMFTRRLYGGLGLKYSYYKYSDNYYTYSSNFYGGGPFARFFVLDQLFLHAECEVLNMEVPDYTYTYYTRENVTSVFLGGGYRQMIGNRSSLDLMLLYNINENRNSPYVNPIFRFGFGFGI
jgi:hypothetical protein